MSAEIAALFAVPPAMLGRQPAAASRLAVAARALEYADVTGLEPTGDALTLILARSLDYMGVPEGAARLRAGLVGPSIGAKGERDAG